MHARPATFILLLLLAPSIVLAQQEALDSIEVPLQVSDGLFQPASTDTLGLVEHPDTETVTVFRPGDEDNKFNHGAVIAEFKGRLFVQWQTSLKDEDSPDTHVVYSVSDDGETWTKPMPLADSPPGAMTTSGGWWTYGDILIAYINVWPAAGDIGQGGHAMYVSSSDGEDWSELAPVTDVNGKPVRGIFEQDPQALPDGRIISAFHLQPGLRVAPFYTDDPSGVTGWVRGAMQNLPFEGDVSREIEPSWYLRKDGAAVMVFRDQAESFRKLAAVSRDRGGTWTTPVLTNMPDARTKQSAGNLPSGIAYLVGNPVASKSRYPLVVTLSEDGKTFDRAWLLRPGGVRIPLLRYEGQYKRPGYSYPKSAVIGEYLYVAYATNKEDIEITRVPHRTLQAHEM
jgi:hypothetical protein